MEKLKNSKETAQFGIDEVPAVRVRYYPIGMEETFDGTVIDVRIGNYIVIPDDDLCRTEMWHKSRCDVLR